ncbi:MAG: hypothetical protein JW963_07380 [Anaerolineales bacterium]|nr:hypothetical protein [Anaerolineales bacterium]
METRFQVNGMGVAAGARVMVAVADITVTGGAIVDSTGMVAVCCGRNLDNQIPSPTMSRTPNVPHNLGSLYQRLRESLMTRASNCAASL